MIGAVSSSANELYGAMLAIANPAALGQLEKPARVEKSAAPPAAEDSQALGGKSELTEEERREVAKLQERDRQVRQHEQAHKAAAGGFAKGGPTFEYETGPDGRRYAVEGEVSIDTSKASGDPQATIQKMQTIRRAALAPGDPSSKDRQVAAKASQQEAEARAELAQERRQGQEEAGASIASTTASATQPSNGPSRPGHDAPRGAVARAFEGTAFNQSGRFIDVRG